MEQLKSLLADAQAWYARLTQRERRLVALAGGGVVVFVLFMVMMSFSSSAAGYRRRTSDKLAKLAEIQELADTYRGAEQARQAVERQLQASNVRLIGYIEDTGNAAGLEISTMNPKADVPIGDGKIVESAVEVTLTDIELKKLVDFLTKVETGPGVIKVKHLRIEPRLEKQTLTAWATIATYHTKK